MKSFYPVFTIGFIGVTLHVRVWIEIKLAFILASRSIVTLHVRVWIEISGTVCMAATHFVTLRVRVWIEVMRHH